MSHHSLLRLSQTVTSTLVVRTQNAAASKDRGAIMAEYGLLIALVALAAFAMLGFFGVAVLGLFTAAEEQYPNGIPTGTVTTTSTTGG